MDANTTWMGQGVRSFLIQAAMTQSKQFIQTTFLAHNWTHGKMGVRSGPHFSGGSADGELVRELSRQTGPLGTSHSPAADLLHYSFHNLCSNFLLLLLGRRKIKIFPVSTEITHTRAVLSSVPELISDFNTYPS